MRFVIKYPLVMAAEDGVCNDEGDTRTRETWNSTTGANYISHVLTIPYNTQALKVLFLIICGSVLSPRRGDADVLSHARIENQSKCRGNPGENNQRTIKYGFTGEFDPRPCSSLSLSIHFTRNTLGTSIRIQYIGNCLEYWDLFMELPLLRVEGFFVEKTANSTSDPPAVCLTDASIFNHFVPQYHPTTFGYHCLPVPRSVYLKDHQAPAPA